MSERAKWRDAVNRVHDHAPFLTKKGLEDLMWSSFHEVIVVAVLFTGKSLTVPGVGTFYRRTRKAHRVTLNGVESVIPEMNEIGFRLSKKLK